MTEQGSDFIFVIDTNEYAGNFEREMCAYLTGQVGECGVGQEMATVFYKETKAKLGDEYFDNIAHCPDDRGCSRPATIWPNPRYANDGMGGHYLIENADQDKLCARYVKAIKEYANLDGKHKFLERVKNGENVGQGWTVAAAQREIDRAEKDIAKAEALTKVASFPAYMSVGIWFETKPTDEQIKLLKERAASFIGAYNKENEKYEYRQKKDFKIEGFRLIAFTKTSKEESI